MKRRPIQCRPLDYDHRLTSKFSAWAQAPAKAARRPTSFCSEQIRRLSREEFVEICGRLEVEQALAVGGEIRVIERLDLRRRVGQS
jgi:hypothetical protein